MGSMFVIFWLMTGIGYTVWRFVREGEVQKKDPKIVIMYLSSLLAWALLTSLFALRNFYEETTEFFIMDVATFVPFAITGFFILVPNARRVLTQWIMSVSLRQLTWIHIIRIAAIGTILKLLKGSLPAHFIVPVGIPDFFFGLSVPIMDWIVFRKKRIGRKGLILWNVVGFLLFFPTLILLYLSVPSPIQVFFEGPNTLEVFRFPMALVPTFIAPVFIIIHNAAILKLFRSSDSKRNKIQRKEK